MKTKLEYHHYATPNKLMALGCRQWISMATSMPKGDISRYYIPSDEKTPAVLPKGLGHWIQPLGPWWTAFWICNQQNQTEGNSIGSSTINCKERKGVEGEYVD